VTRSSRRLLGDAAAAIVVSGDRGFAVLLPISLPTPAGGNKIRERKPL
jgi:hypothetical protein